jgi:serine protease Do
MRTPGLRAAVCWIVAVVVIGGAGTEAKGQYSRKTPIVEAVQKTRHSIVTIKVEKKKEAWSKSKDAVGTGVIVDERGYIVTNRHVIVSAKKITVRLLDGSDLTAGVLVEDSRCDLAILRIKAGKKLPALPLGPGSDLMVGETVIAVGHPFGYANTVSTGIISALDRDITMPTGEVLTNLIQTDASINPGNSGGPLLNINGELIGINVALRDGAHGIAFAINADTVKLSLSKHLSALKIAGVTHGLNCQEKVAEEGPQRQRVVVGKVAGATPAASAGLKDGDEILLVGKRSVSNRFDVERALWDHKPGESVPLKVMRQGKEIVVTLTLTSAVESATVVGGKRR